MREFEETDHTVIIGVLYVAADSAAFVATKTLIQIDQQVLHVVFPIPSLRRRLRGEAEAGGGSNLAFGDCFVSASRFLAMTCDILNPICFVNLLSCHT